MTLRSLANENRTANLWETPFTCICSRDCLQILHAHFRLIEFTFKRIPWNNRVFPRRNKSDERWLFSVHRQWHGRFSQGCNTFWTQEFVETRVQKLPWNFGSSKHSVYDTCILNSSCATGVFPAGSGSLKISWECWMWLSLSTWKSSPLKKNFKSGMNYTPVLLVCSVLISLWVSCFLPCVPSAVW